MNGGLRSVKRRWLPRNARRSTEDQLTWGARGAGLPRGRSARQRPHELDEIGTLLSGEPERFHVRRARAASAGRQYADIPQERCAVPVPPFVDDLAVLQFVDAAAMHA